MNTVDDISPIIVKKDSQDDLNQDLEALSLSELSDDEDEDHDENDENETTPVVKEVVNEITEESEKDIAFDYKKLLVGDLRAIVEEKGLSDNVKKLKKQELLDLLTQ